MFLENTHIDFFGGGTAGTNGNYVEAKFVYQTFGTTRSFKIYIANVLKFSDSANWGAITPSGKYFVVAGYQYNSNIPYGTSATVKNVCIKTYDAGSYCDSPTQTPSVAPSAAPTTPAVVNACYLTDGTTWTTKTDGSSPYVVPCLNAGNNWVFSADYQVK